MFSARHHLNNLPPATLDTYLERGWFRMNQRVFITHFLHFDGGFYPALWLRYPLQNGMAGIIEKKLAPVQKRFQLNIMPWEYSGEQEALFSAYRQGAGIDLSPSLLDLLLGQEAENIFNSYQVEIRDSGRLIALGIFDMGLNSAAGITNIFDPEYRKHSPGKALIYAKMQYCLQQGFHWFYPGYAVPGKSRFNYKLDIAPHHTEYFFPTKGQWLPYYPSHGLPNLLAEMESKICLLQEGIAALGQHCPLIFYRHFDADLIGLGYSDLLAYPMFLLLAYDEAKSLWLIVVYDLMGEGYNLLLCNTLLLSGESILHERGICLDILQVFTTIGEGLAAGEIMAMANKN